MLQIRIQSTPNPNARKYVLSHTVKKTGKVTYKSTGECEHVPMAKGVLEIPGVTQVHFFDNVVTITQDGSQDWADLDNEVQIGLSELIVGHDINFVEQGSIKPKAKRDPQPNQDEIDEIERVLDRTIRPSLQMDGGDIEVLSYKDNLLSISYMGACGGCPSSMTATLQGIVHILRTEYNDQIEVVAV